MESGLQNIYLHNSYFPSVLTKLACNAHTNITGGNGVGKTTILSLIPIFYGIEPSKIVSKAGDKKNFVGYYLPSPKSMLVFEYSRMGKVCNVVIYRNQMNLEYRFVSGTAEDTLFSEASLDALRGYPDANQWLIQHVSNITNVSRQIKTTKDYRAVIQNNKSTLRQKRKQGDSLASVAADFSLCDPAYEMKHIESISSVLMKSEKLLAKFKTMIVDAFLADQIELNASPYHKQDSSYIDNLRSLIELDKNGSEFEATLSKRDELENLWSRLLHFRILAREKLESVSKELSLTHEKTQDKIAEQKSTLILLGDKVEKLSSEYHGVKGELISITTRITSIYDARDNWENVREILDKSQEFENRNALRSAFKEAEQHYLGLLEMVKSERAENELKISELKVKSSKQREKLNATISDLRQKISDIERETDKVIADMREKSRTEVDNYKASRAQGERERYDNVSELTFKKKELTSLTKDDLTRLDEIQTQIDSLEDKLHFSVEQLHERESHLEQLKDQKASRQAQRDELTHHYDTLLKKREELLRRISPPQNSLRSHLNENVPGWHQNIGKVIRPELLDRKNLKPESSEFNTGIYGLTIDLEAVETTEETQSIDILSQKEEGVRKDLTSLDEQLSELNDTIKKIDISIQHANTEKNKASHNVNELQKTKERFRLSLKKERASINAEKDRLRATIDDEIKNAKHALNSYINETSQNAQKMNSHASSLQQEFKVSQSDVIGEVESAIEGNLEMFQNSIVSEKKRISDLNASFSRLIENKGISPTVEKESKERFLRAKERLENAESYAEDVYDYRRWVESTWSEVKNLELREAELKVLSMESESTLKEAQQSKREFNKKTSLEIDEMQQQASNLANTKRELSGIENSLFSEDIIIPEDHPIANALSDDMPVDILISQASDTVSLIKQAMQRIKSAVRKVETIFVNSDKKNKINDYWENIKENIKAKGFDTSSDPYYLECAKGIDTLINTIIPDVKKLTVEQIRSIGEGYIRFYQTLETLNSKVRSVSSMLGREINTKNNFPDIDKITVELVSKVQEYAIWTELSAFNSQWDRWVEGDRNALPDASFLNAFQGAIDGMKSGGIEGVANSRSVSSIEPLVDIRISLRENGREVSVKNDNDLLEASSEGLSRLITIIIFCGATRYLCPDKNVRIHWPLDELGKISNENISLLFDFMDGHNINLFCAQPDPNEIIRKLFPIKCSIVRGKGILRYRPKTSEGKNNPLISSTRNTEETL